MQERGREVRAALNVPQSRFLNLPHKYRAYVAGFGSGKTWVGCSGQLAHFYEHPKINQGYFAPTYPLIRDIYYPTIGEVAETMGLRVKVKRGDHEVEVYSGSRYRGSVICRSIDDPANIVGFKIGHALVDELDLLAEKKAEQAWRKIMARMRYKVHGVKNGIDVTTTPEGFKFVYRQFVKALRDKPKLRERYGLIQASTFDNESNLPDDYIDSMLEAYTPELIRAYLNGQFVNLLTGTVYHQFDRKLNHCNDSVKPGEPLFIGMDFNVGKMAAVTHIKRESKPRAVDEILGGYDTPDMIRRIKERYWEYKDGDYRKTCEVRIYPDASGDSRKSVNASTTDLALLRNAGFSVHAPKANPPVKDRVNAMNAMFCNAKGERRYLVNTDKCPGYSDCLEQQPWAENGEPDKSGDLDHAPDAGGYFIHHDYPLIKPALSINMGMAY
ncbi:terminase large subunit domain-containing protein [Microbulbifer sp. VVAC002]|uniref:terminase large subunit domain-containing protein n=1 Tax=Microbulbifer sp. VVAC002 TaxID=3243387 RepID=UPI0040394658